MGTRTCRFSLLTELLLPKIVWPHPVTQQLKILLNELSLTANGKIEK